MQAHKGMDVRRISLSDIKEMAAIPGPCISIFLPANPVGQTPSRNPGRLRELASQAETLLLERGTDKAVARQMVQSVAAVLEDLQAEAQGFVLYCAPDFFRAYRLPAGATEALTVGNHFCIKPLIPALHSDRPFYILALSQKHIRLLRCTEETSEEIELPGSTPKTLWEDKHTDQPDHDEHNAAAGGPGEGSMKGVVFTTNTDSEAHLEYLAHFYKHVSEGVNSILKERNGDAPLVIAGVDYEIACFRRVNVYANLVQESVHGAPDGLKGGEMHKRALAAVRSHFEVPFQAALARMEQLGGSERVSSTVKDIVKGAYDGRVMELVLAEGARYMGVFDESRHDVKGHKQPVEGDEELLNVAALETILHAGQVFVVPASQVPRGAPAIAVFRY